MAPPPNSVFSSILGMFTTQSPTVPGGPPQGPFARPIRTPGTPLSLFSNAGATTAARNRVLQQAADPAPAPRPPSPVAPPVVIQPRTLNLPQIRAVILQLQNLQRLLREPETSRETRGSAVTTPITALLTSFPILKTVIANAVNNSFHLDTPVTAETIQAYLTDHYTQLNTIIDPLGTPLIEIIVGKYKDLLSETETLEKLNRLKTALSTVSFDKAYATRLYEALPANVQGNLAYHVWERHDKTQDGKTLILSDPKALLKLRAFIDTKNSIDTKINETTNTVRLLTQQMNTPIDVLRHDVSAERLQLRVKGNQLQVKREQLGRFNTLLTTEGTSKEAILGNFYSLPEDVKQALCKLVWYVDGQPEVLDHGMITIQKNPKIFLDIRKSDGNNIIQQLIDDTAIISQTTIQKGNLLALRETLNPTVQADAFRREFERIQREDPVLAGKIAGQIWQRDRVRAGEGDNPSFGGWGYGERTLIENPGTLLDIREGEANILGELLDLMSSKIDQNLLTIIDRPERRETSAVLVGTAAKTAARVADYAPKRVAMISAEFKSSVTISEGGLGEAVRGMAIGHGNENVCVIMPKFDILKVPSDQMQRTAYRVNEHAVFTARVDGIECFFIEDDLFNVGKSAETGANNSIYGDDPHTKARFAHFQNHAAELARQLYTGKKIDVVHLQDSQTALIPTIYAQKHTAAWQRGETPPTVFTYHNNGLSAQNIYSECEEHLGSIRAIGLEPRGYNSFMEGLANADAVTTVSQKFALESSGKGELGRGAGSAVRKAIYDGKLYDVLNGNTLGWDPKNNQVLKQWTDVDTLDQSDDAEVVTLPFQIEPTDLIGENAQLINDQILARCLAYKDSIEREKAAGKKVVMDLTYGPEDHPLVIEFKKQLCKEQVALYLAKYSDGFGSFGKIDPSKPLLLSLGRLDPSQKGIGKLPAIMETALANGAQMIVIGLDGEKAQPVMDQIHAVANRNRRNGAVFIQDERVCFEDGGQRKNSIKWQAGHIGADGKKVPGIGPLLRAAADIFVAPSEYEPCGLTQGESFQMGTRVLATDTGGFHETIFTSGDRQNGWRFDRDDEWDSSRQNDAITAKVVEAIRDVKTALYPDQISGASRVEADEALQRRIAFHTQTQRIMTDARRSTWTETPDGSPSPIDKMRGVYDLAIARQQERVKAGGVGYAHFDLATSRDVTLI